MVSAASATKRPFSVIERKKSGASLPGLRRGALDRRSRSAPARRPGPAGRPGCGAGGRSAGARSEEPRRHQRPRPADDARPVEPQPLTSKPSPVSETNTSSSGGRATTEARARRRRRAPARRRPSRAPPRRGDRSRCPAVVRTSVRPSSPSTRAASRGGVGLDRGLGGATGPQLGAGALGDQPARVHDPDVGAHLLDLGEQVARDQHRRAVAGQRRRSAGGPPGCPAGRGRWSARRAPAGPWAVSRAPAMASRWRMPRRVGAEPLAGGGQQPDPVEGGVDAVRAVAGSAVRSAASRRSRLRRPER